METSPIPFQLRDLLKIASIIVTLTIAWGVFGTRLTVLEKEMIRIQRESESHNAAFEQLQNRLTRLSAHQQDDELFIDQLYILMKRPLPVRRASN